MRMVQAFGFAILLVLGVVNTAHGASTVSDGGSLSPLVTFEDGSAILAESGDIRLVLDAETGEVRQIVTLP